jgi:hypothetical protein
MAPDAFGLAQRKDIGAGAVLSFAASRLWITPPCSLSMMARSHLHQCDAAPAQSPAALAEGGGRRTATDVRGGDGGVREKLAAGMSGAGQAEQATRQRWPPPAPRLRRLLRCHPAGWQSGRGGLSTGVYSGRGDRGEAATTTISNRPRELFVICGQVRPVATSRVLI